MLQNAVRCPKNFGLIDSHSLFRIRGSSNQHLAQNNCNFPKTKTVFKIPNASLSSLKTLWTGLDLIYTFDRFSTHWFPSNANVSLSASSQLYMLYCKLYFLYRIQSSNSKNNKIPPNKKILRNNIFQVNKI